MEHTAKSATVIIHGSLRKDLSGELYRVGLYHPIIPLKLALKTGEAEDAWPRVQCAYAYVIPIDSCETSQMLQVLNRGGKPRGYKGSRSHMRSGWHISCVIICKRHEEY